MRETQLSSATKRRGSGRLKNHQKVVHVPKKKGASGPLAPKAKTYGFSEAPGVVRTEMLALVATSQPGSVQELSKAFDPAKAKRVISVHMASNSPLVVQFSAATDEGTKTFRVALNTLLKEAGLPVIGRKTFAAEA